MSNQCPISGDNHRYFVHTTKVEFEPIQDVASGDYYYQRVEYAYMGCNCGSAVKSVVKDNSNV